MYTLANLLKGNFFIIFLKTVVQLMKHLLHKHRALSLNLQHHKSQSRRPLCNPHAGEVETGASVVVAGLST